MTFVSLGDLARSLATNRQSAALRTDLQRLTQELASGQRSDPGDPRALSGIVHRTAVLESHVAALRETAAFFSAAQTSIGYVADRAGDLGRQVVTIGSTAPGSTVLRTAEAARQALDDMMATLNTSQGGRALFSGTETTEAPLIRADDLLAQLAPVIAGAATATDLYTRIDTWFADPAGFRSLAYRGGDDDLAPFDLGDGAVVTQGLRADDPAFVAILRDTAAIVLANSPAAPMPTAERAALQMQAGEGLIGRSGDLVTLQESLGAGQERIDRQQARLAAEIGGLQATRNDILSADPFETALALQEVQSRLEAFYAATARSSRLGLAAFLR